MLLNVDKPVLMITYEMYKMSVERLMQASLKAFAVYIKEGYSAIVVHQFPVAFFVDGSYRCYFPLLEQSV